MFSSFPTVFGQVFLTTFNGPGLDGGAHGIIPAVQVTEEGNNPQHFHYFAFIPIFVEPFLKVFIYRIGDL